jgi:N-formylglutamate deformylase
MSYPSFTLHQGHSALLISLPHVGTEIPAPQQARLVPTALQVPDTDWHLETLYAFAKDMGASLLVPRYSRYYIDLNRPLENQPMYPGANNTELCPTRAFTGKPIYREGQAPDAAQLQHRIQHAWRPYHRALSDELQRLRHKHGHATLFDGHSIKGELPWLFEGSLPDLNLGTASGNSCAASLREQLAAVLESQTRYSHVVDGRFKGGHITRHYGRPEQGIHAVQLEMAWRCYLSEDANTFAIDTKRQAQVTPVLNQLMQTLMHWSPP